MRWIQNPTANFANYKENIEVQRKESLRFAGFLLFSYFIESIHGNAKISTILFHFFTTFQLCPF